MTKTRKKRVKQNLDFIKSEIETGKIFQILLSKNT